MSGAAGETAGTEVAADEIPVSYTRILKREVEFNGGKFAQIVLREPMADEVRQALEQLRVTASADAVTNYKMHLVAKVSGVPFPVIQRIGISDLNYCFAYLQRFLDDGPPIGET